MNAMKKILYILLAIIVITMCFFYYESYSFNQYIANSIQNDNMNISINENAPVKSRNQIEIEAPIDTVWKILTDIKDWRKWQKAVTETIVGEKIEEGTNFKWKAGGLSFNSKIHTSKPNTAFGWTGTTIGASAIHNWTFLKKDNNTTIVIVEESLQGVFPKLFRGYFQKNLDSGVLTNLHELKIEAEARTK
jgi:uncharacterized membrane protein